MIMERHMAPRGLLFGLLLAFAAAGSAPAQTVAVAANAQYLVGELSVAYKAATGSTIRTIIGSSGVLTAQIRNGAPFDVLLSADTAYPMSLWRDGLAADTPGVYAFGTLIFWSKAGIRPDSGLRALLGAAVRRIAVANPESAPYGAAALVALRRAGLYEAVRGKLVFGESVAQVNQYIDTRSAEAGLTASSVVRAAPPRDPAEWAAVGCSLYPPIPQAAVVLARAPEPEKARAFVRFLASREAREIFARYGYALP